MQTTTTNSRLTVTAFRAAVQAITNLPRNCWNAALEAAESDIAFGARATAAIGNAATAATGQNRRQRATTTARRTTGRKRQSSAASTQELTDTETKVLAALPNSGFIGQSAITIPGMRPNNIGRSLGTLAKKGYITGEKGGSWRRTAEKMAAA